jgi:hypothetical protein
MVFLPRMNLDSRMENVLDRPEWNAQPESRPKIFLRFSFSFISGPLVRTPPTVLLIGCRGPPPLLLTAPTPSHREDAQQHRLLQHPEDEHLGPDLPPPNPSWPLLLPHEKPEG